MLKKFLTLLKPVLKAVLLASLLLTLSLGHAGDALAARSGGRIGGGSFRVPTRTYSAPRGGGMRSPGVGGGIGFPFLLPFFGFGGGFGGLFTLLIVISLANFLINTIRNGGLGDGEGSASALPKVSVAKVQVGLLANARELQLELNQIAMTANTDTATGRAKVLQETTLALLRHPHYWVYGATEAQERLPLEQAEGRFNQLALGERSKFTAETLTNVDNQLQQSKLRDRLEGVIPTEDALMQSEPGEYIVVTILAGVEGSLKLPAVNGTDDLRQALSTIGGVGGDRLLAFEVLWTPQATDDTLTTDDILAAYPNLKLV
ncbi:MAG: DUF1517 domain-containing protein [Spirulinaceae cyanobacterium SM2_1_0]|nr:DUF1517 domain-containing protein [Spirulinaceae cyanobacterium SM2_1_0]